jgi:hypothetical protein
MGQSMQKVRKEEVDHRLGSSKQTPLGGDTLFLLLAQFISGIPLPILHSMYFCLTIILFCFLFFSFLFGQPSSEALV